MLSSYLLEVLPPYKAPELPKPQADQWWGKVHVSMPQAQVLPSSAEPEAELQLLETTESGETDSVLALWLGCRGKAAKLTAINWAGPWITNLAWLNRLQDSVQMFSFVV